MLNQPRHLNQAVHDSDPLTGSLDRSGCLRFISSLPPSSQTQDRQVAVLWIDLDRFSQINKSFGHLVGDSVLAGIARRLARASAQHGRLALLGGDEFALILPGSQAAEAERLAGKLLSDICEPFGIGTTRLRLSASIGIALAQPDEPAHELLERADRAKAEAKRFGGSRLHLSDAQTARLPGGKFLARKELGIEETLHRAFETGGLSLQYQPIVRIVGGHADTVEALMRCAVDGVDTPPDRFIPVAEKTGLIHRLGAWSLVTAASFVHRLQARGDTIRVAVNVSRAQLNDPTLVQSLHAVLSYTTISPLHIELEITESLFMDASEQVRDNLAAIREAGFPLVMDDFGTGYSSLAYLKNLPAEKLKLDRAFVVDLPHDYRALCVARAVTRLARDMGIAVVAEGVESAQQYDVLAEIGVTSIQGYYLARPMAEPALLAWLKEKR